jgi:LPS-assembly protein
LKLSKHILYFLGLLLSIQFHTLVFAQEEVLDDSIIIEGDSIENIIDRKLRVSGNALLKNKDQTVTADLIEFNQTSEDLYAKGNVKIDTPEIQITGNELELSISENTGVIPDATFVVNLAQDKPSKFNKKLRGNAAQLFIEGKDKKRLVNASITTCEVGQNGWIINADQAEIDQSTQTLTAKNSTLSLKGIPIVTTPYADFSFSDLRKSGFLMPTIGSTTRSGMEWLAPYYVNLSPTSDLTLLPRVLGKRGLQLGGTYRYLDEEYTGISSIEFMNRDKKNKNLKERYYINIDHKHEISKHINAGVNFEKVAKNDKDYFNDMTSNIAFTSQVSLSQTAFLNYSSDSIFSKDDTFSANLLTQKFQNLSTSSPYERLPSLTANYSNDILDEDEFIIMDTNTSITYNQFDNNDDYSGATRATGNRFTATPSVEFPFESSFGYVTPKFILDYKNYDIEGANITSKSLFIPTFSIDSGVYFDKPFDLGGNDFIQTLEPRIFYSYTQYKNQEDLPMFDTGLMELNAYNIFNENQFSGGDRVMDSNQITLALSSRIMDYKGFEWLSTTLAQRFYIGDRDVLKEAQFASSTLKNDSSDLFFGVKAYLTRKLLFATEWQFNVDDSVTNRSTYKMRYRPEPGKVLNASYRNVKNPNNTSTKNYNVEQYKISGQWPLGRGWSGLASYDYDTIESVVIESMGGVEYDAGCWSTQIMFHRLRLADSDKPNSTLFIQLELGGLGSLGTGDQDSLFDKMNRNVPGSMFTHDLPDESRENNFK